MISSTFLQVIVIAVLTSITCVLPGIFLVLLGVSLMSDAISHAILLGIILMFMVIPNLHSPLMIIGAGLAGMATVLCTQMLVNTNKLKKDAAIGLVFPLFFSVGVILVSLYAHNVHLDVDMVLLGEIIFAPFNRFIFYGYDLGPCALWSMGIVCLLNCLLTKLFFKELQLVTFDSVAAHVLGFYPTFVYYGLMLVTSITSVVAFDVVGSIVVVALMITPAATALVISRTLSDMIKNSMLFATVSSISGCLIAYYLDVSVAGCIATCCGLVLVTVLLSSYRS